MRYGLFILTGGLLLGGCTCERQATNVPQAPLKEGSLPAVASPDTSPPAAKAGDVPIRPVESPLPTPAAVSSEPVGEPEGASAFPPPEGFNPAVPIAGGPAPALTNGKFVPPLAGDPSGPISPEQAPVKKDGSGMEP